MAKVICRFSFIVEALFELYVGFCHFCLQTVACFSHTFEIFLIVSSVKGKINLIVPRARGEVVPV